MIYLVTALIVNSMYWRISNPEWSFSRYMVVAYATNLVICAAYHWVTK